MLVEEHYLRLRNHFYTVENDVWIEVKLDQISEVLHSTKRNTNFLLRKMEDRKWIRWSPGRGRGNVSKVTFLKEKDDLIMELAKNMVLKSDLQGANSVLQTYNISSEGRGLFYIWLENQLGYHIQKDQAKSMDILRFPFYRPIPFLDPAFVGRRTEVHMIGQIFDTLVVFNEKTDELESHLSHYWTSDESNQIWTFFLRKGIHFHHGKPFTSSDVAYTVRRIQDPATKSPHRWMMKDVKKITCVNEYAVRIELEEPNALFIDFLSTDRLSIVPDDLHKYDRFATFPIGTGPFSVEKNDDSMFILQVNESYFKERAHLDQIEVWVWPNYKEDKKILLADEEFKHLHMWSNSISKNKDLNKIDSIENGCTYLVFNQQKQGSHQNGNFRKAMHHVMNRALMIEKLGERRHMPASGFLPNQQMDSYIDDYDIDLARKALNQSGYKGELLHLYTYELHINEEDASWIQKQAALLGIHLEISIHPIEQLRKFEVMKQADMIVAGEVFGENLQLDIFDMFQMSSSFIHQFLSDQYKKMKDDKIAELLKTSNKSKRLGIFNDIEKELRESYSVLFLYHSKQNAMHHADLKGVSLNALGWVDYRKLWFSSL
ncbi:SgrR family transcriptional regulator [Chengkuizengella axinellae]|uniref:ABC transporter substrate-binding protein n=1 Tax=Chengkuizengella axinellae TaxID=3064388 RepID=A0ABT9IZX1_9BACL|nr:SgrR family transcriptional regulator [Chengkuizengella sp. 2205SS18-9]MDP5274924.1 ABC transporter substrate-binding protein [Chengkuizengella sp. 2205SS18-9]